VKLELAISPAGRLSVVEITGEKADSSDDVDRISKKRIPAFKKAFDADPAEGLFTLAADKPDHSLPPSFGYWRGLAVRYMTELCHTPEGAAREPRPVPPPNSAERASLLLSAPPMPGAEYLDDSLLERVWQQLDAWVREEVVRYDDGLSAFLKKRAPLWHQVGRVCFHLAENRRDPGHPFAFLATYAPQVSSGARVQYQPLSKALQEYAGQKNRQGLIRLLEPVHRASQSSQLIKELVDSGDIYHPLAWTPSRAYRFLKEVPLFEESGLLVRLPDWWKKRPRPTVSVSIGNIEQNRFDSNAMLDFNVNLALGDEDLSEDEWRRLLDSDEGLVLLKGQWVEVDRDRLAEALDHWKRIEEQKQDGLSFIEGMRLLAGTSMDLGADGDGEATEREWAFVRAGQWLDKILDNLKNPDYLGDVAPTNALKATLRPYQQAGVNWLAFMSRLGLGACLADDMGLGKTIQVLALLLALKRQRSRKPSLLVLPASLLANWKSEIERFAPTLRARFVHPSETTRDELSRMAQEPDRAFDEADVVLTTYGMLLRQKWLGDVSWQLVVLDEAQAIKNPGTRQTKSVKRLTADARIALTGTPVENRLSDLWSLFDFLCPGLLGSQTKFKEFVKRLNAREQQRYAPLRRLVQPYILRRLKTDKAVITDLPDKTELRAYCGLSKRQAALYAKLVRELSEALKNLDGMKRRGLVLAYLMRFKQLCNHPSQLLGDNDFAAADSGKLQRLGGICEEIASRQEKTLVFTQFREMTEPLSRFLARTFGRQGLVLHGGTAVKKRKSLIEAFQRQDGPPFFVLSLKAGGTGLNLTEASHVVHFDRWWNPAVENQATDRAFRIGQKRNVLIHKFVCQGTVEERIDALIEEKTELAADLLEGGAEKMLTEMSNSELIDMVSLDVERTKV